MKNLVVMISLFAILQINSATHSSSKISTILHDLGEKQSPSSSYKEHYISLMKRGIHLQTGRELSVSDKYYYELFKELYAANIPLLDSNEVRIPTIIHQIWIGSDVPHELLELAETVRSCNPNFEYRLWRDSDLAEFNLEDDPIYRAAPNWGERADILRYHILNKYGGIYLDMDFYCLRSFDSMIKGVDFVIGISNVLGIIELANGFIACTQGHPIIREALRLMVSAHSYEGKSIDTINRTGPQFITRVFASMVQKGVVRGLLPLPFAYIYPIPNTFHIHPDERTQEIFDRYVTDETYCIHLWHGRWIKPGGLW